MVSTEDLDERFQPLISWLNLRALKNMYLMLVTLEVSQSPIG